MKDRMLLLGVASPVLYALTVILGGALWAEYDHIRQAISELTAAGAPHQLPLNILFSIALICAGVFAGAAIRYVGRFRQRLLSGGMYILLIITVLSFVWAFFPMDPRGAEPTVRGQIHLLLAGIVSPLTILCPLAVGLGLRSVPWFQKYRVYCYITAAIILVTGLVAAMSAVSVSPYMGLYARLTIGTYQQGLAGTAMVVYSHSRILSR